MAQQRINFFDGAQSGIAPTIGNIDASSLVTFDSDAAFEAGIDGAPVLGNIYSRTTDSAIRYYDGTQWLTVAVLPVAQSDTTYDNSGSTLVATTGQGAIDELDGKVETNEANIATNAANISTNAGAISDLETLSGSPGSTDHGTFSGTTIPDGSTTKDALQSLETAVEGKVDTSSVGAPGGVASLDGTGRIPSAQLPVTAMEFKGSFDPTGPTPNLTNGTGDAGDFYRVSVAGSHDFGAGSVSLDIGDSVIYNGSVWEKYDEQTLADTDSLPEGATNLYYTDARADSRIAAASIGDLSDVDTTTSPPTDGQALVWNNSGSVWEPGTVTGSSGSPPTVQQFTSGSGTYNTPVGVQWIRVRMVGGGGGGGSTGSVGTGVGGTGGNTTFGTSLLVANGGQGGSPGTAGGGGDGGSGGTASLGSGPVGIALTGGSGTGGSHLNINAGGGGGAASPFGGAGGGSAAGASAGRNAVPNTGSGGGGPHGLVGNFSAGAGGGAGGYVEAIITSPAASYSYSVGAAGAGASAGTGGDAGGSGGSGYIIVEEYY